jgi:hypothetical protein
VQILTGCTAIPNTNLPRGRTYTSRWGWSHQIKCYYTLHCVLIIGAESVCDVPTRCLRWPYDLHHLVVLQPVVPGNRVRELDTRQLGRFQSKGRSKEGEKEALGEMGGGKIWEEKPMGVLRRSQYVMIISAWMCSHAAGSTCISRAVPASAVTSAQRVLQPMRCDSCERVCTKD